VVGPLGRRIGLALLTAFLTSLLVYASLDLAPGDPITALTKGRPASPELVASLREQYRLDDPFPVRYAAWLADALQGNFGRSIAFRQDVAGLIAARLETTLWLASMAAVLILVFGIGIGLLAALRPGRADSISMLVATVLAAIPPFVAGLVLIWVFAVLLRWLPAFGSGQGEGVVGRVQHLALPAVALAIGAIAYVARISRAALRTELQSEHTMTAVSRGLRGSEVVRRHVLRNAAGPIVTVAGLVVAGLIAGTAVVEKMFALNGIGSLLIDSVNANDFPVVQAIALIAALVFVVVNTGVDLLYGVLDPRIRDRDLVR
jgi:peptide/nickel transport system permease protein